MPGLFEAGFGVTLGELVYDIGGGTLSGRPVRAVQVGGPLGAYFPPSLFDTPFDYEAFAAKDGLIGHGGVVVFDDTVDMACQARFAMEFCVAESCGKCTPCRIGSVRGVETVDKILAGQDVDANLELLRDLCHTMKFGSIGRLSANRDAAHVRGRALHADGARSKAFDVIVTNNMFGDIITDLAAGLQGGLGMAASGNLRRGIPRCSSQSTAQPRRSRERV